MSHVLSRRAVVTGLAATLSASKGLRADTTTDTDVIIIGAGPAGLTAADALIGEGLNVIVLEARDRIGGRAWTESQTLGLPFDQCAHWLHNAEVNSFAPRARALNLQLLIARTQNVQLYLQGERLDRSDASRLFSKAESRLRRRMTAKALFSGDAPLSSLRGDDLWQNALIGIAAFSMAANPSEISFDDFAMLEDGKDLTVKGGYGALIARVFAHVPVKHGHQVTALDWLQSGAVKVSGDWGTLSAERVIVAIPPTVLASGTIRFTPELPAAKEQALASFLTGQFLKVGLRLNLPTDELLEYHADIGELAGERHKVVIADRVDPLLTLIASGDTARSLADQPLIARQAYAAGRVAVLFGADVAKSIVNTTSYDWAADPNAMGSYSALLPGSTNAREIFAEPLSDLVHFAGDAAPTPYAVTVYGAHLSGLTAARAVMAGLAG